MSRHLIAISFLAAAFAAGAAHAGSTQRVNGSAKKDGAVAPALATGTNVTQTDSVGGKGTARSASAKESTSDPYAVPLFQQARPLK